VSNDQLHQCRSCPWRKDCDPAKDIPNGYSVELHQALEATIAREGEINLGTLRVMACHYTTPSEERLCAGWLHNQIGDGNNIGLRLRAMRGLVPVPVVEGTRHRCFVDTLPKKRPSGEHRDFA
jgi:hypothetical protein